MVRITKGDWRCYGSHGVAVGSVAIRDLGATLGSTYGLAGLGFTVIFNTTEIINFAQGEFVMLGGMLAVFAVRWGGLPLAVAVLLAIGLTTLVGVAVDRLTIRPVRGQSVIVLIIITIGVSIVLRGAAMLLFGKDTYPLPGSPAARR